ncbi:MAG TPA: hypothetical protein VLQ90_14050, partial [Pyrinomonadaceae bacterium]|nr:hypothetical protein [Pyrinomonadaceae bacterium]
AVIRVALTTGLGYLCAIPRPQALGIDPKWGAAGLTASAGVAGWIEFALLRRTLNRRIGRTGLSLAYVTKLWIAASGGAGAGAVRSDLLRHLIGFGIARGESGRRTRVEDPWAEEALTKNGFALARAYLASVSWAVVGDVSIVCAFALSPRIMPATSDSDVPRAVSHRQPVIFLILLPLAICLSALLFVRFPSDSEAALTGACAFNNDPARA